MLLVDLAVRGSGSLSEALAATRRHADPGALALLWHWDEDERRLRFRDLAELADRARAFVAGLNPPPGERLLVATRNDGALATLVLAALSDGRPLAIVNPDATSREIGEMLAASRPALAFVDADRVAEWPIDNVPHVVRISGDAPRRVSVLDRLRRGRPAPGDVLYPACLESVAPAAPPAPLSDDAEAYVLWTSGSTAGPRGVRISRRSLFAHARTQAAQFGYDVGTRLVVALPTFNTDGLFGTVVMWLAGGACLRPARFMPARAGDVLDLVYRERATHFLAVPTILRLLLDVTEADPERGFGSDLRALISTAGPLDEALWERLERRYHVRLSNFYGMTETVSGGLFCGPDDESYRRGSIGKPRDCEVRLVDGELRLRGDNVMLGYLGDDEATTAAFVDGWLRTGDLASIDAGGFVHIAGRRKNLVISGGQNIQPDEVAGVLETLPGVREAVVFGVPDELFGERLVACVAAKPGHAIEVEALVAGARAQLTPYKVPREVVVLAALPRGASGKVRVPEVRALFLRERAARAGAAPGPAGAELWPRVQTLAARCFRLPRERLAERSRPDDTPGWDSFAHLELVLALEREFELRLSPQDVARIRSLGAARDLVRDRLGA